jgi:hypothetical protein
MSAPKGPRNRLGELIKRHPALFRGQPPRVRSYLLEGWFALVDELCTDLEQLLGDRAEAFAVEQVKEKFGGLRFYWSMQGQPAGFDADIGGVRPARDAAEAGISATPFGVRVSITSKDEFSRAIAARIRRAEDASFTICESCGAAGRLLVTHGWLETACERHERPGAKPYERPEEIGGVP